MAVSCDSAVKRQWIFWFAAILMAVAWMFFWSTPLFAQTPPAQTPPGQWMPTGYYDATSSSTMNYVAWKNYFQGSNCWGCELYSKMGQVVLDMGSTGAKIFQAPALAAISSFMSVWIVWQLYRMLSVSHANSPAQSIDEIFNRIVLMFVIMAILKANPFDAIMVKLVLPSMGGLMEAGASILNVSGDTCSTTGSQEFIRQGNILLCAMHHEMGAGLGMGAWLVMSADMNIFLGHFEILRVIGGIIIFCAFGLMLIILPFRFFDALIRIATVTVLLPVIILAYLFKPTRGAVKSAITSVLAAGLTFLFTAISISIAVNLLHALVTPLLDKSWDDPATKGIGPLGGDEFMILVAGSVGMLTMIMQSANLASEFAGFQGQMGGAGAAGSNITTSVIQAPARGAGAIASSGVTGTFAGRSMRGAMGNVASALGKGARPGDAGT